MADTKDTLVEFATQIKEERKAGANTADRLGSLLIAMIKNTSVEELAKTFLRKDQEDETSFLIKFLAGIITPYIKSKDFTSGQLGAGYSLSNKDGKSVLEVDELLVRMKAVFTSLEIRKLSYVGDNLLLSAAGCKIGKVEETDATYKCYFLADDGTTATTNDFVVGDQARCQTFNIKAGKYTNVSNKYYWRLVTAVGDDYIELSKTDCDTNSDVPAAGDALIQLGNRTDTLRQNAMMFVVTGENAPAFIQYKSISSYSLSGKDQTVISPSGNKFTGSFNLSTGGSVLDYADNAANQAKKDAQGYANSALAGAKQYTDAQIKVQSDSITEAVGKVDTFNGRMNTAEEKLTPTAINLVVAEQTANIASYMKGKMLYRDPTFASGTNSTSTYNNQGNGAVSISRVSGISGNPNNSGYCLSISTNGYASPGLGGFYFANQCRANAIFITRIIANIPAGHTMQWASNSIGNNGSYKWLTSQVGTGTWKEYICQVTCGSSGDFSSTNFFYLDGSAPVTWYVAYATVFDVTDVDDTPTKAELQAGLTVQAGGLSLFGKVIGLAGIVTFNSLDGDSQNRIINAANAANNAQGTANTANDKAGAAQSNLETLNGRLRGLAFTDKALDAMRNEGIIAGAYMNMAYLDVKTIVANGINAQTIDANNATFKNLNVENATLKNVQISGSIRSPFLWVDGNNVPAGGYTLTNNIALQGTNMTITSSLDKVGKRVTVSSVRYPNGNYIDGIYTIKASDGSPFYEDGITKSQITISREIVELLGYGTETQFFGWIVLNRRNVYTAHKYGYQHLVMYEGFVNDDGSMYKHKSFDGGAVSSVKTGDGYYRVTIPSTPVSEYLVLLGNYSHIAGAGRYAAVYNRQSTYFEVYTGDDSTSNTAPFYFQVISTADWS
jgi:hypothetical protein